MLALFKAIGLICLRSWQNSTGQDTKTCLAIHYYALHQIYYRDYFLGLRINQTWFYTCCALIAYSLHTSNVVQIRVFHRAATWPKICCGLSIFSSTIQIPPHYYSLLETIVLRTVLLLQRPKLVKVKWNIIQVACPRPTASRLPSGRAQTVQAFIDGQIRAAREKPLTRQQHLHHLAFFFDVQDA